MTAVGEAEFVKLLTPGFGYGIVVGLGGSLVLGASATINVLTGMNTIACNFLLPIGIAAYVVAGGLRATFICDFMHTVILFVVIYIFCFSTYASSPEIGSPGKLWELLQQAAIDAPVAGNAKGSYTTMKSNNGLIFAGCTIASGFAGVFMDQGYWQRAIASSPESTTKAYLLGALSWFSIPWAFGSVMGLSARALIRNPKFPTYPYALSAAQQSAGLVAPAAAVTLLGKGGAAAVLIVTVNYVGLWGLASADAVLHDQFMAATSAASAELIAISSIIVRTCSYLIIFSSNGISFAGLRHICTQKMFLGRQLLRTNCASQGTYVKPLTGKQIVAYSHIIIVVFAVWMGVWATILGKAGIDLGWLFYVQGVALTPAVGKLNRDMPQFTSSLNQEGCTVPVGLTVCWSKLSKHAAFWGTIFGTVCGMVGWFIGCWKIVEEINVTNMALAEVAICGAAPGLVMSTIATFLLSWIFPGDGSWEGTRAIAQADEGNTASDAKDIVQTESRGSSPHRSQKDGQEDEKEAVRIRASAVQDDQIETETELDRVELQRVFVRATWLSVTLALIITIVRFRPSVASFAL
ncbi:urea-proton symporter, partial [Phenoliferia sp. Uapishka_3]